MNWINKLIKKNSDSQKTKIKDIPENLWIRCNSCNTMVFKKDLINSQKRNTGLPLNLNLYQLELMIKVLWRQRLCIFMREFQKTNKKKLMN